MLIEPFHATITKGKCSVCQAPRGAAVPVCLVHWHALPANMREEWRLSEDPLERGLLARRMAEHLHKIGAQ